MNETTNQEDNQVNTFDQLARVDVDNFIVEKEGNLGKKYSYLPWAKAIEETCRRFPDTNWKIVEYEELYTFEGSQHTRKVPYQCTNSGVFVQTQVTVNNITRPMWLPVLDNKNKPVAAPDAVQINKAIMRCLVKNFAAQGMGIKLYLKEDNAPEEGEGFDRKVLTRVQQDVADKAKQAEAAETKDKKDRIQTILDIANEKGVPTKELTRLIAERFGKSNAKALDRNELAELQSLVQAMPENYE